MGGFWIRWLEPKLDLSMICFFFCMCVCACVCAIDSIHSDWILPIQIIYIVFCNVTCTNSKSIYFLNVLYFIFSYLFSSGSQLVWLCSFSLTDPRTSTMHLPLVWTSKWALWDGSAHTAVTQGVDILINTRRDVWFSWGCEAAFMPGK